LGAVDRREPEAGGIHAASGPCGGTVDSRTSQDFASAAGQTVTSTHKERTAPSVVTLRW
jgi:hypothetical protein